MTATLRPIGINVRRGGALFDSGFRPSAALQPSTSLSFVASTGATRLSGASAPRAPRPVNRCSQCNNRFGLVRYRHFDKQFCSDFGRSRCKQRYLAAHADELSVRLRSACLAIAGLFVRSGKYVALRLDGARLVWLATTTPHL
jgi:hypothetical protein